MRNPKPLGTAEDQPVTEETVAEMPAVPDTEATDFEESQECAEDTEPKTPEESEEEQPAPEVEPEAESHEPKKKAAKAIDSVSREAALVLIAAHYFGTTDSPTVGYPTSIIASDGFTYSAHKEAGGALILTVEPNRYAYESAKWRVEQIDATVRVAKKQLEAAKDQLAKNSDATAQMAEKLQANVDKLQEVYDKAVAEREAVLDQQPAVRREIMEAEAARMTAQCQGLDKKAMEQTQNAAQWRQRGPDFPSAEAVENGTPDEDRNEARALVCEAEAARLSAQSDDVAKKAKALLAKAKKLPPMPVPVQHRFEAGSVVGVQF